MAYEGYLLYNGREIVNHARLALLARSMGVSGVQVRQSNIDAIAARTGMGTDEMAAVIEAPWYDPGYPASSEFCGVLALTVQGLDDSSYGSSVEEYTVDGGSASQGRNATQPIVANVIFVGSTERGVEYGMRWLNRVLTRERTGRVCNGADLDYMRVLTADAEMVHRRDVSLTRAFSITKKKRSACQAATWATFTLTDSDGYEYGEEVSKITSLGGSIVNLIPNPDYEADVTGTRVVGAGNNARVSGGVAPSGTYYRVVSNFNTPSPEVFFTDGTTGPKGRMPVTAGKPYVFSYSSSANRNNIPQMVTMWFYDAAGNTVGAQGIAQAPYATGFNRRYSSQVAPAGAVSADVSIYHVNGVLNTDSLYFDAVMFHEGTVPVPFFTGTTPAPATGPGVIDQGTLVLAQQSCPQYNYDPLYDPLYPALVPSPTAPDFYPAGWDIDTGDTFQRRWARISPVEPSSLLVVPMIRLDATQEARMVRLCIWPGSSAIDDQCDPLWSVVVSYLPPNQAFYIDAEAKAAYVYDGVSPAVRRTDSLIYDMNANPVKWAAFNDNTNLLVTLDTFSVGGGNYQGGGTVRASLGLIPKSD